MLVILDLATVFMMYPKLDTRISVRPFVLRPSFVKLRVPPLDSETGWTGQLLILQN